MIRRGAVHDIDELHHRIGPPELTIDRVLIRKHALRHALADDHDRLGVPAVGVREIAAGDDRHAQRREEARRDRAEARARIVLAVGLRVALDGELEARTEDAGIPPRHRRPDGDVLHAGQLADPAHRFLVKSRRLFRLELERQRHVQRQHLPHLEAGRRHLQGEQRREQHAGAGQENERRGNLRDGESRNRRFVPAVILRCRSRARTRWSPQKGNFGTNASRTAAIIARATPIQSTLESTDRSSARTENAPRTLPALQPWAPPTRRRAARPCRKARGSQ